MGFLTRGALIEYGSDFMGPIPNVVIFQFNPEELTRNIKIPSRPTSGKSRDANQAGEPSTEEISLVAKFSAADEFGENKTLARMFGVGTRLAALEKMVHPETGAIGGLVGKAIDEIGDALGLGGDARQPIPAEKYPRILFIWGEFRILPVVIGSMSITEQLYDSSLNPIQAEVSISMAVNDIDKCSSDVVGKGALEYSKLAKDAQVVANLANTADQVTEIIPF